MGARKDHLPRRLKLPMTCNLTGWLGYFGWADLHETQGDVNVFSNNHRLNISTGHGK